jgi:hypothetical protein
MRRCHTWHMPNLPLSGTTDFADEKRSASNAGHSGMLAGGASDSALGGQGPSVCVARSAN